MCLAVPAEVLELKENELALIDIGGVRKDVSLMLVDGVEAGDYVLVHAGFAIEKIDKDEARKTLELLEEAARLNETW
ncbi:MAG: HypC/HybG/HupF family hydrogenase formation chaperone [Actinobacteria bacterium]|jgi:hydrogenase expression/formation protein HypC|nr:MAG: HypC/HybG/HupF family hydrogenase formation chaperone [Actinomycetota bacterium]